MSSFASARRRIEQCRICLERDASSGIIPAPAQDEVDRCYLAVATILDEARVEIEAAGPRLHRDEEFREQFVAFLEEGGFDGFEGVHGLRPIDL